MEKCLAYCGAEERDALIATMLGADDANEPLQAMMTDQFANYVVQKLLDKCDERQRALLLGRMRAHIGTLRKYTYGKHIVAMLERMGPPGAGDD